MFELLLNCISKIFATIKDFQALFKTVSVELENLEKQQNAVLDDMFLQTCSYMQVINFEKLCGLNAREGLTLEQRRRDILVTFASNMPYTLPKLQQFLNSCLGVGMWELEINYNKYKISVHILKPTENGIDSLARGLLEMIPCHIAYDISSDIYINNENDAFYTGGYLENKVVIETRQPRG